MNINKLRSLAKSGNATAQLEYAAYHKKHGDIYNHARWLMESAENNNATAQYKLSKLYSCGPIVDRICKHEKHLHWAIQCIYNTESNIYDTDIIEDLSYLSSDNCLSKDSISKFIKLCEFIFQNSRFTIEDKDNAYDILRCIYSEYKIGTVDQDFSVVFDFHSRFFEKPESLEWLIYNAITIQYRIASIKLILNSHISNSLTEIISNYCYYYMV